MLSVVSSLLLLICIRGIGAEWENDVIHTHDNDYPPHYVSAGTTIRLTCLEHIEELSSKRISYRWYYDGRVLELTNSTGMRLANGRRTLLIDDMNVSKQGKYKCVCICRVWSKKRNKHVKRKCRPGELGVPLVEHKTFLLVDHLIHSGYCDWTGNQINKTTDELPPDFRAYCNCHGGNHFDCAEDMKLQRRQNSSHSWTDVTEGNTTGEVMFGFDKRSMRITIMGSKLAYEAAGFYRCVSFRDQKIVCVSQQEIYLPSPEAPAPLPAPNHHFEILWYVALPLVVSTGTILLVLCTLIIYFKYTTRIIVKSKNSALIQRLTVPTSTLYPDLKSDIV